MAGFNYCGIVVGLPGWGKTTLLAQLIRRHLTETKGIVLAHDPVRQFVKGAEHDAGCSFFTDANAWRRAAAEAAREKKPMPRGASIGGADSEAITKLAMEIGRKLNDARGVTTPILAPSDEGSLREGSGSTFMSKQDNELFSTRRHLGIGPVINLQEAKQLQRRFFQLSTDIYLFRQTSDRADELNNLLFLERGTLERAGLTRLEKHHYVHVRVGQGVVSEAL